MIGFYCILITALNIAWKNNKVHACIIEIEISSIISLNIKTYIHALYSIEKHQIFY